ncbi:Alpha/Beta hydrolase protein, partial [Chaetomium sp. MPI-SDFR-AT-0129]
LPTRQSYITLDEFTLESGTTLINPTIAFTFIGLLNATRDNVILVCHALSGSADFADWWVSLLNPPKGKPALDPTKWCIICCNTLGSPYGSASPLTYYRDNTTGERRRYGADFPATTIRDDVRIHKQILDILGVRAIHCVIGSSMGGMTALEWPLLFGAEYVRSLVLIATAARQSAWGAAWAEAQRCSIRCDPKFRGGDYELDDPPTAGLAAARMAALLTYRTHQSFEERFGGRREGLDRKNGGAMGNGVSVLGGAAQTACLARSYLQYQGSKFNARFDTNCYLHILDKIDSHDIARGRCPLTNSAVEEDGEAIKMVLGRILQPTLVVGIPTDGLYPVCEQYALYEGIPNAAFAQLRSEDGHDGFLLEAEQMNQLLLLFLGAQ